MNRVTKLSVLLAMWSTSTGLGAFSYRAWGTTPFPTTVEPQGAPIELASGVPAPRVGDEDDEWFESSASLEQLESWRALAAEPVHLVAEVERNDRAWVSTLAALEDPHLASDERLACGEIYVDGLKDTCAYRLTTVVRPASAGDQGTIVYSRADLASVVNGSEHVNEPACARYVNCVAASMLGRTLPLPPDSGADVALSRSLVSRWTHPSMNDPAILRRNAELMSEDALRRIDEDRDVTAQQQAKLQQLRNYASYMDARADRIESRRTPR